MTTYNPKTITHEIKVNRIRRLLNGLPDPVKLKYQWDDEALWSLTNQQVAKVICSELTKLPHISAKSIITDATASVGGTSIPFAKHFSHVNSIENNMVRKLMLDNNIKLCDLVNISTYYGDCRNVIPKLKQDIIFFDPPWGINYKDAPMRTLRLKLSGVTIENLISLYHDSAKYCAIKLPCNYDFMYFEKNIKSCEIILTMNFGKPNSFILIIVKFAV